MENKDLTQEYKDYLLSLKVLGYETFLKDFKELESYKEKENFLNTYFSMEIFNILKEEEFLKLFYLDSQAKYILDKLHLEDLDNLKTLVYCYNTNSREFNKKVKEEKLKKELLEKGFKEVEFLIEEVKETKEEYNKRKEDYYKNLDGLKVICVFDINMIGVMGSYTNKAEKEGKLIFNGSNICFLPKRNRTRGQILTSKFYYKEIK